jgi:hypothetical protein
MDCTRTQKRSSLPAARIYEEESRASTADLLERMRYPTPEAVTESLLPTPGFDIGLRMTQGARTAYHEGRLAQMGGRSREATDLWLASANLGHHLQHSADGILTFLMGCIVETVGMDPAWTRDYDTDPAPGGPAPYPQFYYGREHSFFASQVGEAVDAGLRDRYMENQSRAHLFRAETLSDSQRDELRQSEAALRLPIWAVLLLAQIAVLALLFAVGRPGAAPPPEGGGGLHAIWRLALGLLTTALIVPGLAASLAAAACRRRRRQGTLAALRSYLRDVLPVAIALTALLHLWVTVRSVEPRAASVARYGVPEMQHRASQIGEAWDNSTPPPDAWHAEYPPDRPAE